MGRKRKTKKGKCSLEVWVRGNSKQVLKGKGKDKVFEEKVVISNHKTDALNIKRLK